MRLICLPWPPRFANQPCWPTSFLLDAASSSTSVVRWWFRYREWIRGPLSQLSGPLLKSAINAVFSVDCNNHMVARLNRVQAKRRPCQHEISGLQTLAETTEITAKPLKGLRRTAGHGPQGSRLHARAVDGNGQSTGVCPIFERSRLEMLRDDRAGVDAVIGHEFGERLPWGPEYELVQLDDGKSRRDPTINPYPKCHLALD